MSKTSIYIVFRSDLFDFLGYLSRPRGKIWGTTQKIAENRVFTAVITTLVLCASVGSIWPLYSHLILQRDCHEFTSFHSFFPSQVKDSMDLICPQRQKFWLQEAHIIENCWNFVNFHRKLPWNILTISSWAKKRCLS